MERQKIQGEINWKKISRDVVIICAITCTLSILSEIGLRIIFPEKISRKTEIAYQHNKDYLVSLKPNVRKTFVRSKENGSKCVFWKTNKNSFRGEEIQEYSDIKIIVYGDSNIQARFSNLGDTFSHKLKKYLKKQLKQEIEVLNAGIVGFGPDQSLIKFSIEADTYKPDLVIFHIFAHNDFGDIIRNRLFELDVQGKLIRTKFKREIDERLRNDWISSLLIVRGARKVGRLFLHKNLHEKELSAQDFIDKYLSVVEREYSIYKQPKLKQLSTFRDQYDIDIAISPNSESSKTKVKLLEAVLRESKGFAEARDIEFLVLIQPSIIDLTQNFKLSYKNLEKYEGYKPTNLSEAVEKICIKYHIHRINLFDIFKRNAPEDLFFKINDMHWNDQGQDLAARKTGSYVVNNIILK